MRNQIKKTPVPNNSREHQNDTELARSWIQWTHHPESQRAMNQFGEALDALLRRYLPDGNCSGSRWVQEGADLRQEVAALLLGRYLLGNERLTEAVLNDDRAEVDNQIRRSTNAAATFLRQRMRQRHCRRLEHERALAGIERCYGRMEIHRHGMPDLATDRELRGRLVREALRDSVSAGKISPKFHPAIDRILFEGSRLRSEAPALGISVSALSRRLSAAVAILSHEVERIELFD